AAGRFFPLGVGRQPPACPTGVSVGFVPAHPCHRLVLAVPTRLGPLQWLLCLVPFLPLPPCGGPERLVLISACLSKQGEAGVGDRVQVNPVGGKRHIAFRFFVVLSQQVAVGQPHPKRPGGHQDHRRTIPRMLDRFVRHGDSLLVPTLSTSFKDV